MAARMHKGQILVRLTGTLEGTIKRNERVTVKCVLDENYIEIEEHEGRFLRDQFEPANTFVEQVQKGHMSDLAELEAALLVIDNWNRTRPTGMMVSVEAAPAQDGGSLYSTASYDSNDIGSFIAHLLDYASHEEKAAALERAAKALRFGL